MQDSHACLAAVAANRLRLGRSVSSLATHVGCASAASRIIGWPNPLANRWVFTDASSRLRRGNVLLSAAGAAEVFNGNLINRRVGGLEIGRDCGVAVDFAGHLGNGETIVDKLVNKVREIFEEEKNYLSSLSVKAYEGAGQIYVEVSTMYEYVPLQLSTLMKLSKVFGTEKFKVNNWNTSGCETCDYGSKYTHEFSYAKD